MTRARRQRGPIRYSFLAIQRCAARGSKCGRGQCNSAPCHSLPEITMNANAPIRNTIPWIGIAAVAACAVLSGATQANDHPFTIRLPVSTAGLDLSQPAGAGELYGRLKEAARIVCGSGNRVGLEPVTDFNRCYEKA